MYRRPYRSFRTRKGAFPRRRFGPRLRTVKEPQRWEVGHFALSVTNLTSVGTPNATIVVPMAQIADHFGVDGTAQGRVLDNAVRWIEVGGIVFSYRIRRAFIISDNTRPQGQSEFVNQVDWRTLLVTDRLDSSGSAQPASIPNWFNTTPPIILASAAATEDEELQYPTRIHWSAYHGTEISNIIGSGTTNVGPASQVQDQRTGRASLRLRLRIDDEHGLFLHFAQRQLGVSDPSVQINATLTFIGQLYYRIRF